MAGLVDCDRIGLMRLQNASAILGLFFSISFVVVFNGSAETSANKILIEKKIRRLTVLRDGAALRTYRIALGSNSEGPKTCQGDGRTPEGNYFIESRNQNSQYHRSLKISYPNAFDRQAAQKAKCNPGGDIFIHGLPNGRGWIGKAHTLHNWTLGCIAVTDEEIEEIWRMVPEKTLVEIKP
jgi:murein L,D-transpeptidase YafK